MIFEARHIRHGERSLHKGRDGFLGGTPDHPHSLQFSPCPGKALPATHAGDLYLALACSQGNPKALALFDRHFLVATAAYLTHAECGRGFADELGQRLRARLFVAQGSPAKIATYTGRGPLGVWLRTVASRVAVDLRREDKQNQGDDKQVGDLRAPGLDPELDYLKTLYRGELGQAFRATLAALHMQEGNILRLHFLEGMTVEALAGLYRTSERTMTRRIAEARQRILDETRRLLAERLHLPESQVNTLMGMAQSQMQSVVREFFAGIEPGPGGKKSD